jgi:hypothetical protein
VLKVFKGIFHRLFPSRDGKSGNGNGIIHRCFTAQRYPGAAGEGGTKSGNGNSIIHRCFTAQRYPGAAGKGGTEKRKRKLYYPTFFYCAEISWSRLERRDGKAETETVYYPSLFYCAEISWSRRGRRDGKAETETASSPRAQVMQTLLSLCVYSTYKKPWVCFLYLPQWSKFTRLVFIHTCFHGMTAP